MAITQSSSISGINSILNASKPETAKKEDPLGKDAFLTMLVAQLKNQDPLNPMQGTDFTAQLSQFSSLEQLFNMNDSLASLKESFSTKAKENLIDYIGKNISIEEDTVKISNGKVIGGLFSINKDANVSAVIYDEFGKEVNRINLGSKEAGTHGINWTGKDVNGELLPDGTYYADISALDSQGRSLPVGFNITGKVDGVTFNGGIPYLVMNNILIDPSSVLEVSEMN
ncbi:MAG: flagellar hook assembly protein FlgD [Desulfobacterales bacterium]|nr:flagellar hook assembly protein FlgD [Desulfobacterales bacterium]